MTKPPSYDAIHSLLNRKRGPAHKTPCTWCYRRASAWAYMHDCQSEIRDKRGLRYSADLSAYSALCSGCHRPLDVLVATHGQDRALIAELRNERRANVKPELRSFLMPDGFGGIDAIATLVDHCPDSDAMASHFYDFHYRPMCREVEVRPVGYATFMKRMVDDFGYLKYTRCGLLHLRAPWHGSENPYDFEAEMTAHFAELRAAGAGSVADRLEAAWERRA